MKPAPEETKIPALPTTEVFPTHTITSVPTIFIDVADDYTVIIKDGNDVLIPLDSLEKPTLISIVNFLGKQLIDNKKNK